MSISCIAIFFNRYNISIWLIRNWLRIGYDTTVILRHSVNKINFIDGMFCKHRVELLLYI